MITYGLGIITYRSKDELNLPYVPALGVNISVGLTKAEYDELRDSILKIGVFLEYADLFSTIRWNFEDLINIIRSYLQAFAKKDTKFLVARDMKLNINKDLLNILSAVRFYLDYMDHRLKDTFGKTSDIVVNFKTYLSTEYDNNFSYRFIYHLRNYAQHKGFLINELDFGENPGKENQFQINYYLNVHINRNELLKDKEFKKELRIEIEELPEKINIMEHVVNCMKSIEKIHHLITRDLLLTVIDDAKIIKQYLEKLSYNQNDDKVMVAIFETDHSDEDIKQVKSISHLQVPTGDVEQILSYK